MEPTTSPTPLHVHYQQTTGCTIERRASAHGFTLQVDVDGEMVGASPMGHPPTHVTSNT